LDTQTASAVYRVRWQVELLIKRLKSLLDIDLLKSKKTVRSLNFICKANCCMRRLSRNCQMHTFMPTIADKLPAA
jgi:IS4 transposase